MDQLKKLLDYLEPKFKKINLLLWMIVGLLLSIAIGTLSFLHTAYSLLPNSQWLNILNEKRLRQKTLCVKLIQMGNGISIKPVKVIKGGKTRGQMVGVVNGEYIPYKKVGPVKIPN